MTFTFSRRRFIGGLGAVAASTSLPASALGLEETLYPPMDLSYFDRPIRPDP